MIFRNLLLPAGRWLNDEEKREFHPTALSERELFLCPSTDANWQSHMDPAAPNRQDVQKVLSIKVTDQAK
jgi:hypothetical protein